MRRISNLEIHLSHACNLSCESCSHYSNQGHKGNVELKEAARWCAAWSDRVDPATFSLLGGEPTIHPDLPRFVEHARQWWPKAHLRLVTNGWFLHRHPELPRVLHNDPNATIYLSIHDDGPEYKEKLGPIRQLLREWEQKFKIQIQEYNSFRYWTRRYRGFGNTMEPFDDQDPRQSWKNCLAKHGIQLFEGNIWKCAPLAYLRMQDARHGLSDSWQSYLQYQPLKPDCSEAELNEFFDREDEPCCAMCPAKPEPFRPLVGARTSEAKTKYSETPQARLTATTAQQSRHSMAYFSIDVSPSATSIPKPSAAKPLASRILHLHVAPDEVGRTGWRPRPLFRGKSETMENLACHVSRLSPGITPHPPHSHEEEELLIMLSGGAELQIVGPKQKKTRKHFLRPGSFVYYPAGQLHTLHNLGPDDACYLMFKWRCGATAERAGLQVNVVDLPQGADQAVVGGNGFQPRRVLEGPTHYLQKLHVHRTTLQPGAGYRPHADPYDVALVLLEGTVETLGERLAPNTLAWYAAGQPHGIRNPGKVPAVYLVFEFHGGPPS